METRSPSAYDRLLPYKRALEVAFWIIYVGWNAAFNSITVAMDIHKSGLDIADWEPVVWECSSNLIWLVLIWPLVALTARWPLRWKTWWQVLALYVLASGVFSVVHVIGMYGLRALSYRWLDGYYAFGAWVAAWPYEYLKDIRTFFVLIVFIEAWRLLMRRLQGEARLLDVPDEGPPVEPVERPERFLIRKLGREFLIAAADVEWARASGNYVNLRVRSHDYPLRSTLAGLLDRLDPQHFVRVHRSYVVNLSRIASIEPLDSGDARIHLHDGTTVPCSRNYRTFLRQVG